MVYRCNFNTISCPSESATICMSWSDTSERPWANKRRRAHRIPCQLLSGSQPNTSSHVLIEPAWQDNRSPHKSGDTPHLIGCNCQKPIMKLETYIWSFAPSPLDFFWLIRQGFCLHHHYEGQILGQSAEKAPPRDFLSPSQPKLIEREVTRPIGCRVCVHTAIRTLNSSGVTYRISVASSFIVHVW